MGISPEINMPSKIPKMNERSRIMIICCPVTDNVTDNVTEYTYFDIRKRILNLLNLIRQLNLIR